MLTVQMQYDAVKEFPEVWSGVLTWAPNIRMGVFTDGDGALNSAASYHTLLGLFAAATGCGVVPNGIGTFDAFDMFVSDESKVWTGGTALEALVAAYRAGVRA